jgi:hypothetical protein
MPHEGHVPGSLVMTSGCMGHVQVEGVVGMSCMPQEGHVPGSLVTTSGCMGHVQAEAAAS